MHRNVAPVYLICSLTMVVHFLGRLLVQCTQAVKNWLPFNLLCAVPIRLPHVRCTKMGTLDIPAVKKWLLFYPICSVTQNT